MKVAESCLRPTTLNIRTERFRGFAMEVYDEFKWTWYAYLYLPFDPDKKRVFEAMASTMDDAVTLAFEKMASSGALSPDECKEIALDLFEEVDVTVDVLAAI